MILMVWLLDFYKFDMCIRKHPKRVGCFEKYVNTCEPTLKLDGALVWLIASSSSSKLKHKVILKSSLSSSSSSSSYPVYPAHRQLWSRSGEGRKTTAHTHIEECGQRVPRLKTSLQRERNLQLSENLII